MVSVLFKPHDLSVRVEEGTSVLQAARLAGVVIESPCNGEGTCGKCKVRLDGRSLMNVAGNGTPHLPKKAEDDLGLVLACRTEIRGNLIVEVPIPPLAESMRILSFGKGFDVPPDGFIRKIFSDGEDRTRVYAGEELVAVEEGNTADRNYGAVVDIGTTTLVASLVDIGTGSEIASASSLNPQSRHAQDVLSRIKFASNADGRRYLQAELVRSINGLIADAAGRSGVRGENVYEVVFSGNTCMLHLAAGADPAPLGRYPYTPQICGGSHVKASDLGLEIAGCGLVYLPPIISAYVGADITSGILASRLRQRKGVTLFVDIGTNGEMVMGCDGKLLATSTAAGPAFEGMNITFGMTASTGAIERFEVDRDGDISLQTIGGAEAAGICGSGLLDIVGELVAHGVINRNGTFVAPDADRLPKTLRERIVTREGKRIFRITEKVFLTQKDIRQVQLAKGAIRSGIEFLLRHAGVVASDVDGVLIAGSFGYHLRPKSLLNTGIIPPEFDGKVDFLGNTSLSGGRAFLINKGLRERMAREVKDVKVIELANDEGFEKTFARALAF
jgi:uncharacterized 2Fe-2S/4Fe-4S cluster protein (DUF4445 family)